MQHEVHLRWFLRIAFVDAQTDGETTAQLCGILEGHSITEQARILELLFLPLISDGKCSTTVSIINVQLQACVCRGTPFLEGFIDRSNHYVTRSNLHVNSNLC